MKKFYYLVFLMVLVTLSESLHSQTKELTLDAIFKDRSLVTKSSYWITPLSDGKHYLKRENDTLKIYDYKTGASAGYLLALQELKNEEGEKISMEDFSLSKDGTKMLIATAIEPIYRHSFYAEYYIYDLQQKRLITLSNKGPQRLAEFSPDGSKVAFVRDNNLYIKNLDDASEIALTTDGKINEIINGTTDWVYEEEFGFTKGFFWSPDGSKIAYYRFDETRVKQYCFPKYGKLYPENYCYKYPKAGEDNSIVDVYVYHIKEKKAIKLDTGSENDQYLPRMQWAGNSGMLAIQRLNRLQNHLEILLYDPSSAQGNIIYNEDSKYYIEITDDLNFTPDGTQFFITSQKNGYNHIYLHSIDGKINKQLTLGQWEVDHIIGYDAVRKLVYFSAAYSSPLNREICTVDLKGHLKIIAGQPGKNTASFNPNYTYFVKRWSNANTPYIISVCDARGKELRILENNAGFSEKAIEYQLQPVEFFSFTTSYGITIDGWMIKPPHFDAQQRYPVLVYLYGGPGSQTVSNDWEGGRLWYQMMALHGIVVVSVDNRGTGFRGEEFRKMTYGQLGKYETEDQIELAKYLVRSGIADSTRIGIFGWSYGGFMSSLCMTKGSDYFSTGIAVAPVTNWRYYDNIYTERYMGLPQSNPQGYDDNSPIHYADRLKGNYLLIHGTADDNVHFQNSVEMISALVKANKHFQTMYYPDSNHGIYTGPNTTYHLYTLMTEFLYEHLLSGQN